MESFPTNLKFWSLGSPQPRLEEVVGEKAAKCCLESFLSSCWHSGPGPWQWGPLRDSSQSQFRAPVKRKRQDPLEPDA